MSEKKAVLIAASSAELAGRGVGLEKLLKKAAVFTNYSAGELLGEAIDQAGLVHLKAEEVASALEKGTALCYVDLGDADSPTLDRVLATVLEAADRKTVVAVAAKDSLALYGVGIQAKGGLLTRTAKAEDVIPTLAYIADFPITGACTGAILYQALKSPNLKLEEIGKLKEALIRMEGALARDNREPWDKHDCA
jgi:hypothetical protein